MTGPRDEFSGEAPASSTGSADGSQGSFEDALLEHGFDAEPPTLPVVEAGAGEVNDVPTDKPVSVRAARAAKATVAPRVAKAKASVPATGKPSAPLADVAIDEFGAADTWLTAADADADAPVVTDVATAGAEPETASAEDRWWLEPSDAKAMVLDAAPPPAATRTRRGATARSGPGATAPRTLPDLRLPTPPTSLFAKAAPTPSAPAAPDAGAPDAESGAFEPWAYQPPSAAQATTPPGTADFWAVPDASAASAGSAADAVAVDENWASPGFAVAAQGTAATDQAYPLGADDEAVHDGPGDDAGASVDWYEAAALAAVGTTTNADTSNTEFVGYTEGVPAPADTAEAAVAAEAAPLEAPPQDDPWASQAFLERMSAVAQVSGQSELSPRDHDTTTAADEAAPTGDDAAVAEVAATAEAATTTDEAWPVLSTDPWPESTSDGWPDAGMGGWASLDPAHPAVAEPAPTASADVPAAGTPDAKVRGRARKAVPAAPEEGPFSRYAAAAGTKVESPTSKAASADTAGSDLWKLVKEAPATETAPATSERRSIDPVSIFLTILVAIVIVALLAGFLVFAGGLLGR